MNDKNITGIDCFLNQINELKSNNNDKLILFRGQCEQHSNVYPSILRNSLDAIDETNLLIKEINKRNNKSISLSNQNSTESFLIEMQQKNTIKTRLLDVTSNPLVALYNTISDPIKDDCDGVVYVFIEYNDFLSEIGSSLPSSSNHHYLKAKTVALLKELYLDLAICGNNEIDITYCFIEHFNKLQNFQGYTLDGYKARNYEKTAEIIPKILSHELSVAANLFSEKYSQESTYAIHRLFLNFLGVPIHIIPHYNSHEQIIANRILLQSSSFLIWPNKYTREGEQFVNNVKLDKYESCLFKLIIPKELKNNLRNQISLFYNDNQFYIDAMGNKY